VTGWEGHRAVRGSEEKFSRIHAAAEWCAA
jgi:hypothetical protein